MSEYPAWSAFQSLVRESYYGRVTAGAVAVSAKAALAEQVERAEQAEAAMAERERMLRLAWQTAAYVRGLDFPEWLADLRALAEECRRG